ncbi:ribosomal protein S18-alanine N-acetyltransferase [Agromyces kandeliae]|uniref:Ribosomal-protein-alanine N-acetyltransferase n=1 Tax=Agromyces kandeliae TaxID=2666141 RepID=A0A6L5R2M3_9MICO|nr:ribosomal protein S18-alanine N-acetyltransferase [Agromyces kandeliae]MRX44269.1 ribosomal-protein-alanine N-acetyltransferase [Agromyces kandeliae]
MSLMLRRAGLGDLDAIMRLERATFVTDAWPESAMRSELESPHGYYLVAVDDSRPDDPVAYAGLLAPRGSGQGDIQTIAVDASHRGAGLGRALMQALIGEARRRAVAEVFLEVRADNTTARQLYASLGFIEIGVRRGYYRPDDVDAITMRLDVPPAVTRPASEAAGPTEPGSGGPGDAPAGGIQ